MGRGAPERDPSAACPAAGEGAREKRGEGGAEARGGRVGHGSRCAEGDEQPGCSGYAAFVVPDTSCKTLQSIYKLEKRGTASHKTNLWMPLDTQAQAGKVLAFSVHAKTWEGGREGEYYRTQPRPQHPGRRPTTHQ